MDARSEELVVGANPRAVIDALKARALALRSGRSIADRRRIGLVVEGGGMRGVCSAGSLVALADLGLTGAFDEVYATSAGAMNASYFLSNQARRGITVYYQEMSDRRAMSLLRPWRILDIDWIIERVVGGNKRLDAQAIRSSRTRFFVSLLDARTGEQWLADAQDASVPLLTVLKACTAVPVAYNRAISVNGRPCIDAGVASPFPLREALASECTDLLVLLTRPREFLASPPGKLSDWLFRSLCARGNPALFRAYAGQPQRETEQRAIAVGGAPGRPHVNIATLCPDGGDGVSWLTTDPHRLHAAAVRSGKRMLSAMGAETRGWTLPPIN